MKFGELVCVCSGASIGCVSMWCETLFWRFFFFHSRFCFMAIRSFFCMTFGFFCKSKSFFFFWGKTRDSENTVLNIFFRVRSGGDLIDHRSVSGGQRQKGAKMNAVILFFFFLSRQRHFRKDKTHKTHILQHIHLSYTTQNQHFFLIFSWNWCGEQVFIYFSSLGFSFGLFLTFFKWWQWLEGHSFGLVLGIFVFELFGFIRIYSVFSAGLAWWGIMAKTLPEISSNWAFTLSMTGSIWALFKI